VEKNSKDMVKSADTNQWNKTIQRAQNKDQKGQLYANSNIRREESTRLRERRSEVKGQLHIID